MKKKFFISIFLILIIFFIIFQILDLKTYLKHRNWMNEHGIYLKEFREYHEFFTPDNIEKEKAELEEIDRENKKAKNIIDNFDNIKERHNQLQDDIVNTYK